MSSWPGPIDSAAASNARGTTSWDSRWIGTRASTLLYAFKHVLASRRFCCPTSRTPCVTVSWHPLLDRASRAQMASHTGSCRAQLLGRQVFTLAHTGADRPGDPGAV